MSNDFLAGRRKSRLNGAFISLDFVSPVSLLFFLYKFMCHNFVAVSFGVYCTSQVTGNEDRSQNDHNVLSGMLNPTIQYTISSLLLTWTVNMMAAGRMASGTPIRLIRDIDTKAV